MIYELTVRRDVLFGHGAQRYRLLAAGDRLRGEKRIAYIAAPLVARDHWLAKLLPWLFRRDRWMSPWDQLTRLPVHLHRGGGRKPRRIGLLAVDLPYWVQQFATQLQVAGQENQPRAIADLLSFAAYLARLIGKIHLWSFRAPDYPRRYPWYEFRDPFNDAERAAAAKAAGEAGVELDDRLAERLPGEVEGLERSVVEEPPRLPPQADQQKLRAQIRLTRYGLTWVERRRAPRPPVLLIHGLGASGNTFTLPTVRKPLVKYLVEEGFDPWVLDLRTSIGLASSKRDWTFDETAFTDIPRAIKIVLDRTGARRVHVVAHCIGAAMFSMAALAGKLPTRRIGRVVLSQAGPLMELPPQNRFRGYLASYLKHYLDVDEFDTAASLSRFNRFLDRVLAAYPYPEHETLHHHPLAPWKELTHEAYCVRAYGIYGRLFEHANLNAQTLERLGDYLGHVRYRTYQQTIFYATMRRLTDASGRNRYVTPEKLRRHFRFPVCFLHGARNEVFDVQTARRSFDLLASVFWDPEMRAAWAANLQGRSGYAAYASGRHLRVREIEGYGHQDCMIGARAHRDVYPHISDFLAARSAPARELRALFVVRPPRMGPIVGWTSRRPNGDYVGRMVFVPNDSRSKPLYAMTAVVAPGGKPVPGFGKFHRLRELQDEEPPAQAIDVVLPGPGDYRVLVVTVHREQYEPEPERGLGDGRQDDPFGEDFDRFPPDLPFPKTAAAAEKLPGSNVEIFVQPVLDTCKDLGLDGEPLAPGRRVSDPRYASPVSFAVLSHEVLKAGEGDPAIHQDRICFALASCRYAANVADRELADRELGRIRDRLEAPSGALTPQLLVLAGDTIYADATYGIFDPTLGIERYDQRYLEAWTAPNARAVMRRLPVLPMLDDHELEENYDGVRIPRPRSASVEAGMDAFESFALRLSPAFPSPRQPRPVNGRYDYEVTSAGFGFFVMDTRTRRARALGAGALQASLGEDQLDALEGWLARQHPDKAKFVVSPSVFAPWAKEARGHAAYSLRTDAWDAFPGSLHRVLDFLATRQIRNVIFLSGDYHSSVLCRLTVKKARLRPVTAYSIVSSGLYSPYPFANTLARDLVCEYRGTHRDWLGGQGAHAPCCDTLGDLRIRCTAWPSVSCASFALVSVATDPLGATWLEVEFDEARTPLRRRL
jgi:pimeloyl-ACP methyl ester carboxylesterase